MFSKIMSQLPEYRTLEDSIATGNAPVHVYGLTGSQKSNLIYSLCAATRKKCLVVASDEIQAGRIMEDLSFFFCREKNTSSVPVYFPAKEYIFYDVYAANRNSEYKRLSALASLNEASVVVTTMKALMQYTVPRHIFSVNCFSFSVGDVIDIDHICSSMTEMGYKRVVNVEATGQYSRRGAIIDVFCPTAKNPVRIELFDDEIDSMREFDCESQMSLSNIDKFVLCPVRELLYSKESLENVVDKIKSQKNSNLAEDLEKLTQQHYIASGDKYMPFFYEEYSTLLDYMGDDYLCFYDEPSTVFEGAKVFFEEQNEIISDLLEKGLFPKTKKPYILSYGDITGMIDKKKMVSMSSLSYTTPEFRPKELVSITAKTMQNYGGNTEFFKEDVHFWKQNDYRVIILANSRSAMAKIHTMLDDDGIEAAILENTAELPPAGTVSVTEGSLTRGFEYPSLRIAVVTETDIFTRKKKKQRSDKFSDSKNKIKSFEELTKGDYVVHKVHGIGQYAGLEQIKDGTAIKDFIKIRYKGTDVLYIPVDQLDSIHKYVGATEGASVNLNSLNSSRWNNTVKKVRESVQIMAEHLIKLYAARQNVKGHVFEPDTPWQKDFEDDFGYDETPDQLRCIQEVKNDMEQGKCMDRLLCGDVGYGKTEVALRAAFKCVMGGLQVAYLVPTTLLAQQHYNTFISRMNEYGVNVELLCRFRSKKEQNVTIERLKQGKVDILIGTHRILSKDVEFKNLGLLIIDEEQRFGVGHKEKLKELKTNVNVLTLSATPIPRTLNMAMVGIRDLSVIASPPQDRYPVQTFVMERNDEVMKNAIERELARNGQVYYLYNRVDNIERKASLLRNLLPDAVIDVAHGQMTERELESKMLDMINGDTDVLVCTTIIETGIDIPNVNTMIIDNADMLGLSQLYQLRGRVGRSNRLSYAYLMYEPHKVLDETARKRLSAIKEFTEFGSGFRIAMRDLEIRGAGNLLGKEQHGNMNLVGYDMYCNLLEEAVMELKGEKKEAVIETTLELKVDAHIPHRYIEEEEQRFVIYKKIADICSEEDYLSVQAELTDRYGDMPPATANLIDCAYIRHLAQKLKISLITRTDKDIIFTIDDNFSTKAIVELLDDYKGKIMFSSGEKSYLSYKYEGKFLNNIKIILQKLINSTQEDSLQL